MKILLLADTHIRDANDWQALESFGDIVAAAAPDIILGCGDYVHEGVTRYQDPETPEYERLFAQLSAWGKSYTICGNHDALKIIRHHNQKMHPDVGFSDKGDFVLALGDYNLICLQTPPAVTGRVRANADVTPQQLQWLAQTLQTSRIAYIIMHHPPAGQTWSEDFAAIIRPHAAKIKTILYAHQHWPEELDIAGVPAICLPPFGRFLPAPGMEATHEEFHLVRGAGLLDLDLESPLAPNAAWISRVGGRQMTYQEYQNEYRQYFRPEPMSIPGTQP